MEIYQYSSEEVQPGIEGLKVELDIVQGELLLSGGGEVLLEGAASTNVKEWAPRVTSATEGTQGSISVRQLSQSAGEGAKNKWDYKLTKSVPVDLDVSFGAGMGILNLQDVKLSSCSASIGAGELTVDLTGMRAESFSVDVDAGAGEAILIFPKDVGVRADVSRGIGSIDANGLTKVDGVYINPEAKDSEVVIDVKVTVGVGQVTLSVK